MTLAIADDPRDLRVIGLDGLDRLNAPFFFDIDVVSDDPDLDCAALLQRHAGLQISAQSPDMCRLSGQIKAAKQLHRGPELSLYRLRLAPALQRLSGPARRRSFNGLTVLQIITRLLHDHGLTADDFRFDRLVGAYPCREHCVQYDESDLHFLRRLCEEEGISFRHEHHLQRHMLVFSDDPLSFPEWPGVADVEHMAERWSVRTSYSSHSGEQYVPPTFARARKPNDADNQSMDTPSTTLQLPGDQEQARARQLERLRCERRDIVGRSRLPWLISGRVIRIEGQADAWLNDQWLLTDVRHCAWQLAPLRDCASIDVIHILQAMASESASDASVARLLRPQPGSGKLALEGYGNTFHVLPWAMPFRPALEHPKPIIATADSALLVDDQADAAGRLRIRYDWQSDALDGAARDSWTRVSSSLGQPKTGARLRIQFFEGDPDQPVTCGIISDNPSSVTLSHAVQLAPEEPCGLNCSAYEPSQRAAQTPLRIDSDKPMTLRGGRASLFITPHGIEYAPHDTGDPAD